MGQSHIPCPVFAGAEAQPEATAIVDSEGPVTFAELNRRIERASRILRDKGASRGERVGIHLPNEVVSLVISWACLRCGTVAVPLSTRLPLSEAAQRLKEIGCKKVITRGTTPGSGVAAIHPDVFSGDRSTGDATPAAKLPRDRMWTAIFTSGSSGSPRAAVHTLGAHLLSAEGSRSNIALSPGDRWLLSLPLYHVGGFAIAVRCWQAGAAVVIPSGTPWRADLLNEMRVTHLSLVTTQLLRLLDSMDRETRFPSLGAVLLGGSAIPGTLLERAVAAGLPVHVSYGSTEMASQIATTRSGASIEELKDTSGRILPFRSVRFDESGELFVRGATRFSGYATRDGLDRPFDTEGWFATGDIGSWLGGGHIRIEGRKDRMFISGGENIHPEWIEKALARMEGIDDALVVPVPDADFGFRPVAFIRCSGRIEASELETRLRASLPGFMVPEAFLPLPDAEAGMKHDRRRLAVRAEKELGRRSG